MKYQIIGKNIEVTEGIKEALLKKLHRMDKYFVINDDVECRAVVRTYKTGQKVEITIFTKMMDFRAEVIDNDLYAAFDLAIDKLEGQMRKLKTRLDRRNKDGLGKSIAFENFEAEKEEACARRSFPPTRAARRTSHPIHRRIYRIHSDRNTCARLRSACRSTRACAANRLSRSRFVHSSSLIIGAIVSANSFTPTRTSSNRIIMRASEPLPLTRTTAPRPNFLCITWSPGA